MTTATLNREAAPVSLEDMRQHWQEHRALTRRVIEKFPEKEFFSFSIGGMRTFAEMVNELLEVGVPSLRGVVRGEWAPAEKAFGAREWPKSKEALLELWDQASEEIDQLFKEARVDRFQEEDSAFGMWKGKVHGIFHYAVDNEIHHRGQGYVYLRALGIEPPPFWERNI